MWSTWCSVLIRYRIGPCDSASLRIATAFVGSWGVSMMTTPSDVVTKLGLQPRSLVSVKTFAVTCSITSLGRGQAAIDGQDLTGDERRGVRTKQQHRADQVLRLTNSLERDAADEVAFENGVGEQARHLRRVDEGRRDRIDGDVVLRPLCGPLTRQRVDRALGRHVCRIARVDPELAAHRREVEDPPAAAAGDHRL